MQNLPAFKPRPRRAVIAYLTAVFAGHGEDDTSYFHRLVEYPDGHYRAFFRPAYFKLAADQPEPSRSQWNTLKKKMKRHNAQVFIFRAHGTAPCDESEAPDTPCYYIDFGFFAR